MVTGKALNGKPYAGNPHVRFDEGAGAPRHSGRSALLYKNTQKAMNGLIGRAALIAAVICVAVMSSFAGTTLTWNGEDGASWTTGENWLDGETPSAWVDGANAVFPSAATVTLDGAVTVSNLTTSGALTITGTVHSAYSGWLSTTSVLVFPGLTLDDLDGQPLSAEVHGTYAEGNNYAKEYHFVRNGSTATTQFQKTFNGHLRCIKVIFTEGEGGIYAKTADSQSWMVSKSNSGASKIGIDFDTLSAPVFEKTYLQASDSGRGVGVQHLRFHAGRLLISGKADFGGALAFEKVSVVVNAPISQTWTQTVTSSEGWLLVKGFSDAVVTRKYGYADSAQGGSAAWLTKTAADNVFTNMVLSHTVPVSAFMGGSYVGYADAPASIHHVNFNGQTMTFQVQHRHSSGAIKGVLVKLVQTGANVTAEAVKTYYVESASGYGIGGDLETIGSAANIDKYSITQNGVKSITFETAEVPSLTLSAAGNYLCYNMCADNAQIVFGGTKSQPTYLLARNGASVIYNEGTYNSGGLQTRRFEAGSTLIAPINLKTEARANWLFNASTNAIINKNYFNELTLQNGTHIIGGGNLQSGYYNASPTSTYASVGTSANFIETPMVLLRHNQTDNMTNTLVLATAVDLTVSGDIKDDANSSLKGACIIKRGAAKLTLSGNNTFEGRFTIEEGTVEFGSNTALPASAPLTLAGGTVTCGSTTNTTGVLTLSGDAAINLEGGSLAFADSSGVSWTPGATLAITGDDKLPTRSLRFGSSENGLTAAQLRQVTYNGERVSLDSSGYLRRRGGFMLIVR